MAENRPTFYPVIRYRDPEAAAEWLIRCLGFQEYMLHREDGVLTHGELVFGDGIVMLGPGEPPAPPSDGAPLYAAYVHVEDPDALHDRARAAGARVTMELTDQPYGSREFAVVDPEGYTWSFGTYRPAPGDPPHA